MKATIFSIFLASLITLSGCSNAVYIGVKFTQPQIIATGDLVKFNGNTVGEVEKIDTNDSGTRITLELDPKKITELTTESAAIVSQEPERHINLYSQKSGKPIESGAEIRGLNNAIDLATWSTGSALGSLEELFKSVSGVFNQLLNKNNWGDITKQLNESLSGLSEQSADSLKALSNELEQFIKNMRNQSSDTLKQADEITKQLNKELKRFQAEGKDEVVKNLQQLLDVFNSALKPMDQTSSVEKKGEPL